MSDKVFVTGYGIISAIGNDKEETFESLKAKKSGISDIKHLGTFHQGRLPAGEIDLTNKQLLEDLGLEDEFLPRTYLLALKSAKEAIEHSGIGKEELKKSGLFVATTVGGFDKSEKYYDDYLQGNGNLNDVKYHDAGSVAELLAEDLGVKGYVSTISTACSSSLNTAMAAANMIKAGIIDRAIVGGSDALTRFTINGFNSLYILDSNFCRPFDDSREGLNLGEGAAFLVLESERVADKKNIKVELKGYGNANDAYHQTASSPEGRGGYLCMKTALETAGVDPSEIDYINAHGTGTPNNDSAESNSLVRIFGEDNVPKFSTTKTYTGHTLGAAGAVEMVFSILSIEKGMIFPNLNENPNMEDFKFSPVNEVLENQDLKLVLANSFGFGGNCSSVVLGKYEQ